MTDITGQTVIVGDVVYYETVRVGLIRHISGTVFELVGDEVGVFHGRVERFVSSSFSETMRRVRFWLDRA